jgi:hypothetical protein
MRAAAVLALLAATATPAAAEVTVRVNGGTVDLTATAAPLADVLDRLGRQTGMRVVYEGSAPRQLVTLSLQGRTPTEAVLSVLEGLGVNFALVADATGARVQTLVVAGAAAVSTPSSPVRSRPTAPVARRPFAPPPGSTPETLEPAFEEVDSGDDVPEEMPFPGVPPGTEVNDPTGGRAAPDPTLVNPGASQGQPVPLPEAGLVPIAPLPNYPTSPFAPQPPQPFPPIPPGGPGTTTGEGGPAPTPGTPDSPPQL